MSRLDVLKRKKLLLGEYALAIHCKFKGSSCPEQLMDRACVHCFANRDNLPDMMNRLDEVIHEPN